MNNKTNINWYKPNYGNLLYNWKVILKLPCQNFYSMVIEHMEYAFKKIYKLTYHIFLSKIAMDRGLEQRPLKKRVA